MTETPIDLEAAQKTVEAVTTPREFSEAEKQLHMDRLRKEGRWKACREKLDEIRHKLLKEGMTKKAACNGAWVQAVAEFRPLPEKKPEEPKEPEEVEATAETLERIEENSSVLDIRKDVEEAFRKLRMKGLSINSFDREGAYLFWKGYKDNIREFLKEYGVKYLGKQDEDDPEKRDERDEELGDLHMAMEAEFPVEGTKEACPACRAKLQLPNSLRTGDDVKSPEFQLRVADPSLI